MIEQGFAIAVFVVCALLLLRLVLPAARRARGDAALRAAWLSGRGWLRGLWHWRAERRAAARAAEAAIERARRAAERDGNVVRPESFKRPRKPH
jgi:hypothetical protein